MYVCINVCMYVCMYVGMYVGMYVCILYVRMYVCMYVCMYACGHSGVCWQHQDTMVHNTGMYVPDVDETPPEHLVVGLLGPDRCLACCLCMGPAGSYSTSEPRQPMSTLDLGRWLCCLCIGPAATCNPDETFCMATLVLVTRAIRCNPWASSRENFLFACSDWKYRKVRK